MEKSECKSSSSWVSIHSQSNHFSRKANDIQVMLSVTNLSWTLFHASGSGSGSIF